MSLLLLAFGQDVEQYGGFMTEQCKEKIFPISVGGEKDEQISCVMHDEDNQQIIVVGNSTSENFVPAANDHGIIYAVDYDGNWKWGRFYYNVSFPLQTFSGCQFDAAGAFILSGRLDDKPVVIEVNKTDGHVNRFFQLDPILEDGQSAPWFRTYFGLHHEISDRVDQPSYFYLSFIMDDKLNVIKFRDEPDESVTPNIHPIEWNYEYEYVFDTGEDTNDEADTWKNKKSARFLHADTTDPESMFMMGRLYGRATVIKFNTRTFSRDWMLQIHDIGWSSNCNNYFDDSLPIKSCVEDIADEQRAASPMHDIVSIVQPTNMDAIFACGYGFHDGASESVQKYATVFKMDTSGYMYFIKSWGTPVLDDTDASPDVCRSVTFDYANNQVVFLLETISEELRPNFASYSQYSYKNADMLVVIMNVDGRLKEAVNLNFDNAAVTFGISEQAFFIHDNRLVFGGQSFGFKTKFQNVTYNPEAPYNDGYLFNLDLGAADDCFYTSTKNREQIEAQTYDYGNDAPHIEVLYPPVYIAEVCESQNWAAGLPEVYQDVDGDTVTADCPLLALVSTSDSSYRADLYDANPETTTLMRSTFPTDGGQLTDWYTKYINDDIIGADPPHEVTWTNRMQFTIYSNRYCQGFDLLDTMNTKRMCAAHSANLTDGLTYYQGTDEKAYHVGISSDQANVINMMDSGVQWLYENGTSAEYNYGGMLGRYQGGYNGGSVYVFTQSEEAIGQHRTILRGCSNFNELLELYLYVNVLTNTYPDFESTIQTTWELDVVYDNTSYTTYTLPELVDAQGNDEPEMFITVTEGKPYPDQFMTYDNSTRTISWLPDSIWYTGNIYYFDIIVKERNSQGVIYAYHCQVNINGDVIDARTDLNYTDLSYELETIVLPENHHASGSSSALHRNSTGSLVWSHPVNLTFVQEHFYNLFDVYVKNNTWVRHNQTMQVKDFIINSLGEDNRTMNYTVVFDKPYMLGLLVKKPDRLYVHLKYYLLDTYGFFKEDHKYLDGMFLGNASETRMFHERCEKDRDEDVLDTLGSTTYRETIYSQTKIPLLFDMTNDYMTFWRAYAINTYWYLLGFVILQFCALAYRGVGYFPLWTMIEYMQLAAFLPLYNFRMIPYLYDVIKPLLVTHLILTNKAYVLTAMEEDYFDINYDYYGLNIARLAQALTLMTVGAGIIIMINIVAVTLSCFVKSDSPLGHNLHWLVGQFKFNLYIRYYMLCFFDLTFFSIMKLVDASEGNDNSRERKMATLASYVIFTLSLVMPVFFVTVVCVRQPVMRIKGAKSQFNTLVCKVDKGSRARLFTTFYYFFRRLLTAMLLAIPSDNTYIFLQYVFILMSSHTYVLYLVSMKPYQTALFNNYVLANETFYSALIIAIFIFSDATPELSIKVGAAIVLIVSVNLMILSNFVMVVVMTWKGRERLKDEIKRSKLRRAEKELMEEEEEEERRQRTQKEEEDFTKLPDDAEDMADLEEAAAEQLNDVDVEEEVYETKKEKKKKKRKGDKKKGGADDDQLLEFTADGTTTMGNTTQGLMNDSKGMSPEKKKKAAKKKKRDKKKVGNADDLQDAFMNVQAPAGGQEGTTGSGSDKKKDSNADTDESSTNKKKRKAREAAKQAAANNNTPDNGGGDGPSTTQGGAPTDAGLL